MTDYLLDTNVLLRMSDSTSPKGVRNVSYKTLQLFCLKQAGHNSNRDPTNL